MTWISIAQVKTFTLQVFREYPLSPQGWTCPQEYWTVSMCQQFLSSFQRKWARVTVTTFPTRRTFFVLWTFWERHGKDPHCWEGCFFPVKLLIYFRKDRKEQLLGGCGLRFCWTADTTQMIHIFRVLNVICRRWPLAPKFDSKKNIFQPRTKSSQKAIKNRSTIQLWNLWYLFCPQAKWPLFSWVPRWGHWSNEKEFWKFSFETGLVYISTVFTCCCWSSF